MKTIFDAVTVGGIAVKNRIVRSATFELPGDPQGRFGAEHARIYDELARGGVGTIITGMVAVHAHARLNEGMVKAYEAPFAADLRALADQVHAHGCALVVQVSHCGIKSGAAPEQLGPSAVPTPYGTTARSMTLEDIAAVPALFAAVARTCREAGADGVQLHGAHGYLLSQFLSPYYNTRTDAYGGSIENRARLVFEVYEAVRQAVGPDFAVWIKINSTDMAEPSITLDECLWVCRALDARGLNAIEVSGGLGLTPTTRPSLIVKNEGEEGSFAPAALAVADAVRAEVISVGGYRTPARLEEWLNKGAVAALALSRPLISEPDLVNRWQSGDVAKARCISCNKCFTPKAGFGCQVF